MNLNRRLPLRDCDHKPVIPGRLLCLAIAGFVLWVIVGTAIATAIHFF